MNRAIIISKFFAAILAAAVGAASTDGCAKKQVADMNSTPKQNTAPRPADNTGKAGKYEKATFAAGCFWGVEASFRAVEGVVATSVGYTGGQLDNPTYKAVCTDKTGHAEAVEVTYDPNIVSYQELLAVFWKIHDPTTPNRQGPDVGTQYRSAILYHNPQQQALAQDSMKKLHKSAKFDKPIVTEIIPAQKFYKAEEYHQRYLEKQGKTSCSTTIH